MSDIDKILAELNGLSLSAITEVGSGKSYSAADFKAAIRSKVYVFYNDYAIREGHSVLLLKNNSIDFFIDFMALLCIGATIVPLDKKISSPELEKIKNATEPFLIVTDEKDELSEKKINEHLKNQALILFTSGTTTLPKGVVISKKALLKKMDVLEKFIPLSDIAHTLCFVPTYFGHGLICNCLFPLLKGKHLFISDRLDLKLASTFSETIEKYRINFFSSVPSHWEMILEFSKVYRGDTLKRVHCASAPLKKEKLQPILNWINQAELYDVFGATEMLGWFACRKIDKNAEAGIFENFWDVSVSFSPDNELLVSSDFMFTGYWTKNGVDTVSVFNTGDIFRGNRLIGRSKNVIIKNGLKIQAEELNAELSSSGLIKDVAVFPVDDKYSGEAVGVFVVLRENIDLDSFKEFCRKNLSALKIPKVYKVVNEIPVNNRGKCSLNDLKKFYEAGMNE